MRVLRFLLAAVAIAAALFTGFFALAIVAIIGLVALVVQSVRRRRLAADSTGFPYDESHHRSVTSATGEVIDVEATETVVTPEHRLPADRGL